MTAGQKTQADSGADVVVGIMGQAGPALLVYETNQGVLAQAGDGVQPLLMSTLASGRQAHDLLVVNPGARQLQVAFREDEKGRSM
jgi:hypothetical protein